MRANSLLFNLITKLLKLLPFLVNYFKRHKLPIFPKYSRINVRPIDVLHWKFSTVFVNYILPVAVVWSFDANLSRSSSPMPANKRRKFWLNPDLDRYNLAQKRPIPFSTNKFLFNFYHISLIRVLTWLSERQSKLAEPK